MKVFIYLFLLLTFYSCAISKPIKNFTSDGCSCFPEGTKVNKKAWEHCCLVHDSLYWQGGSRYERKQADSALCDCVAKAGYPKIAKKMYIGVRLGGGAFVPAPWRWGFGWNYGSGYQKKLEDK